MLLTIDDYLLEEWWVRLFEDAMAEFGVRGPNEDVNPVFAYLVVLHVLDLPAFFASIDPAAVEHGLLNGELELERRSDRGLRPGRRYRVEVALPSVEEKRGRTLGDFRLVTVEATITGEDCEIRVLNRIVFAGPTRAEARAPAPRLPRTSELPRFELPFVTAEGAKLVVALTDDPSPLHWDEDAVRARGLGSRPINPGSNAAAYALRMVRDAVGSYDRIRAFRMRFIDRVLVGDRLVAGGLNDGTVWLERIGPDGAETVLEGTVEVVARKHATV